MGIPRFSTPSNCSSGEGDTIVVHGGTHGFSGNEYYSRYDADAPILVNHGIQIVGLGEVVFDIGNVTKGALVTAGEASGLYVENITFQNAHNRDFNAAGIRHQAGDLTVVDSVFYNNENGIMGGADYSTVTILDSEFDSNGMGDGFSHAVYINKTLDATLLVENSYFHDTRIGHHIKSLTENTIVRGNRLDDGDGTASMAIDVTAGGNLLVENNTITQSATSDNPRIIYYDTWRNNGQEGEVIVQNNIIYNKYAGGEILGNGTDRMPMTFENNVIFDETGDLSISAGLYNSYGNTLNGDALPEGDYVTLSQPDVILPESLAALTPAAPFEYAEGPGGVSLSAGWGDHTLEGTDNRDVLKSEQKGLKTLIGGLGSDLYLLSGQWTIVEKPGEGFDWAIGGGAWNFTLPNEVEAYWNVSTNNVRVLNGNASDNLLMGGKATNETLYGHGGDDTLYGGGTGGDMLYGGEGSDTVVLNGMFSDYQVTVVSGKFAVTYADGSVDTVGGDVELLRFDDLTIGTAEAAAQPADGGDNTPEDTTQDDAPTDDETVQQPAPAPEPEPTDGTNEASPLELVCARLGFVLPDLSDLEALAVDGVYKSHGWGSVHLYGTDGTDVLEAQSKGTKTMVGGAGDDIYLLDGQWAIQENADEGFDWAIGGGGWAFSLPDNVEAYWNNSVDTMRHLTGNAEDNLLIGGGSGERISGGDGSDVLFGGGSGGDAFYGGAGTDTVAFEGNHDAYGIVGDSGALKVKYADGSVDTVYNDVEFLSFADQVFSFADFILG